MQTSVEICNVWSNQTVDIWLELGPGVWRIERRNIPLWNWMGSLRPYPRLCRGAYLFPVGTSPLDMGRSADGRAA